MTDFVTSLIRTVVPMVVGSFLAWLATKGVNLDASAAAGLTAFAAGVLSAVYYAVVRLVEQKNPAVGKLLGVAKTVEYSAPKQG